MATQTQVSRLRYIEGSVPDPKKLDLSVLTNSELNALGRYISCNFSEHELRIVKTSVYPKLFPESFQENPA
jgi:hypothetical protein